MASGRGLTGLTVQRFGSLLSKHLNDCVASFLTLGHLRKIERLLRSLGDLEGLSIGGWGEN